MLQHIIDIANEIRDAASIEEAARRLQSVGSLINMPVPFLVDDIREDRAHEWVRELGLPGEMIDWWYSQRIVEKHPDIVRSRFERTPFLSRLSDVQRGVSSTTECWLLDMERSFHIFSKLLVPVHLPGGATSVIGWISDSPDAARSLNPDCYVSLMGVAHAFVDILEREGEKDKGGKRKNALSRRERQALEIVAHGGTMKEAARQLELSPFTVRYYLSNAMKRLGAKTLPQLVSLAIKHGEIGAS